MKNSVQVLFFGPLSDLAESRPLDLPDHITTIAHLRDWLGQNNPALDKALRQPGITVAINAHMAESSHPVCHDDEIAFMSPMSGG